MRGVAPGIDTGEICALPPAFGWHDRTAMRFGIILGQYVLTQSLGETYAPETGFLIARDPDTVRAPDFAFIQSSHVPLLSSEDGWVRVIPDLVVEVVSSGDRTSEVGEKVQMWLDAGVRLIWVARPQLRTIEVYRPGASVLTFGDGNSLDGYDVVPGFTAPVSQIFG
ncbi:MAG: Uma2 family endonuclease [Ktedonobacterales bacterium]